MKELPKAVQKLGKRRALISWYFNIKGLTQNYIFDILKDICPPVNRGDSLIKTKIFFLKIL